MCDKYLRDSNILISMLMCQVFHRSRHCLLSLYPLLLCKPVTNDSTISRIASSNLIRNNTTDNRPLLNKYQIFPSTINIKIIFPSPFTSNSAFHLTVITRDFVTMLDFFSRDSHCVLLDHTIILKIKRRGSIEPQTNRSAQVSIPRKNFERIYEILSLAWAIEKNLLYISRQNLYDFFLTEDQGQAVNAFLSIFRIFS